VPKSIREASLALGATKLQTAFRTVVPAALPGIFGAVVLGVGRVIGETMVVLMAAGNAALNSVSPLDPVRTLSASIAAEMAEVVTGSAHYNVLFFLGIVLLLFTSAFNWLGDVIMNRFLKKVHGHG
jgi:phosphate transport system permease protein